MLDIKYTGRLTMGEMDRGGSIKNIGIKHGESELDINKELIEEDIERLKGKIEVLRKMAGYEEAVKKHLQVLVYLESLLKRVHDGVLDVVWFIENNRLKSYPEFKDFPEMGVRSSDYINSNRRLYELSFKDLAELISLEIIFKDIGEDKESIESYLRDEPLVWLEPKVLLKNVEEEVYAKGKMMRIENTVYKDHEGIVRDYFGVEEFNTNCYIGPLKFSVEYAMLLILEDILKQSARVGFKVYGISEYKILLSPEEGDEEKLYKIIKEPVQVIAFGRKFIVEPEIKIY